MPKNLLSGVRLDSRQRATLAGVMLIVSMGYVPLNRLMSGGTTMAIWLDIYVPFQPEWIVPYLMALAWWVVAGLWAYKSMDDGIYLALVTSWFLACVIGYAWFVFYPTYMVRPEISGNGWAEQIVRYVYGNDRTHNAFPSMHVWATVTITLFWSQWKPRWRGWLVAATIIVALSTVLSGQHWILDVVGGAAVALICYALGPRLALWLLPIDQRTLPAEAGEPGR